MIATLVAVMIALPGNPTPVERSAASELADGICRMTGNLPRIVEGEACDDLIFFVGATDLASVATNAIGISKWKYDEILVAPVKGGVVLTGHPIRGPIYAVDTYLEDFCGVRWWTSVEADYPHLDALPLPEGICRHAPCFKYREAYYKDAFNADFKVRLKGNFSSLTRYMLEPMQFIPPEKGGDHRLYYFKGRRSSYHSFFEVLPPARYFHEHPDWYSADLNGMRRATQLCLSNSGMANAFIKEIRRLLRADPGCDFVSISQNDGADADEMSPCACQACQKIEAEEGGAHSGPILRFANRVAEALEDEFPDLTIDTFAYAYSRSAPKLTRPRHNVVVRFCDMGQAFASPLAAGMIPWNQKWVEELARWSDIAKGRLFVWDYTANFSNYILPHPNLYSLAPNIRTFAEAGAIGVFEQGDALCEAGDFNRLKLWIVAHLLWNPAADDRALVREFATGYYGRASRHILEYFDIVNLPAFHGRARTTCYHDDVDGFMFPAGVHAAWMAMDAAARTAVQEGEPYASRVQREKLSIDHAVLLRWKSLKPWYARYELKWPHGKTRREAAIRWAEQCRRFGVVAYRESTEPNFESYAADLLEVQADQ